MAVNVPGVIAGLSVVVTLAAAASSAAGDPSVRVSSAGLDGDLRYDAADVAVAHDPGSDRYLVAFSGDDDVDGVDGENEIRVQLVDAATGAPIGVDDRRVTNAGPDGDPAYDAVEPDVAWSPAGGSYLLVWSQDDDAGGLVAGEFEIFGRRLDPDGIPLEAPFRISAAGVDGDPTADARRPAVAWSDAANAWLVAWEADGIAGLADDEFEIVARLVPAAGLPVAPEMRVSSAGPDGDPDYDATDADVAALAAGGTWLVVWSGEDDDGARAVGEFEIGGRLLDGATAAPLGPDLRLSAMGTDGDDLVDARTPSVAASPATDEYLVAWSSDDDAGGLVEGEQEIFVQRVDGTTGLQTGGDDVRISEAGGLGDASFDATDPAVAWVTSTGEWIVAWTADTSAGDLVNGETEVYVQRLDAGGGEVGDDDVRVSDMGSLDGDPVYDAADPAVAVSAGSIYVSWTGDDDAGLLSDDENEAYGQRLGLDGGELGGDVRLSALGIEGDRNWDARDASIAHNGARDEFLVVWAADDLAPLVDGELEIFAQRIDAATGAELGLDDVRVSVTGVDGDPTRDASDPAVAWNPVDDEYLVVWEADGLFDGEDEIFARRLGGADGLPLAPAVRLSDMGPDGDTAFDARQPDVAFDPVADAYLVVWRGDDDVDTVSGENEIFGQLVSRTGLPIGTNDLRISDAGPDGESGHDAVEPAVAAGGGGGWLVVWAADDLVNGETEIHAQRIDAAGLEIGTGDLRVSTLGPDGDTGFDAGSPDVAWDPSGERWLVVYDGDDAVNGETEVFARFLAADGTPASADDLRLSAAGPHGDTAYDAETPVATARVGGGFLVAWSADDLAVDQVDGEAEIFVRRIASDGLEPGEEPVRLTNAGPDADPVTDAIAPAVAGGEGSILVAWTADDPDFGLADEENEIFAVPTGTPAPRPCPGDATGDGAVAFDDLVATLASWGDCSGCPSDFDGDGDVDFDDLLAVLGGWGACP